MKEKETTDWSENLPDWSENLPGWDAEQEPATAKTIIVGIDPSATHGGIAVLNSDGEVLSLVTMPPTPEDIYMFFRDISGDARAYLEDVGHGIPGQSSAATAKFARHCGHLEMALLAAGIPTTTVTPQKWMRPYQLGSSKNLTKTEWKNKLKAKAQQLFPSLGKKLTLANCDALLIAYYGVIYGGRKNG